MRILAAIVTHNRSALLSRCLDAIELQTRKPDGLLIINNASTDDTEIMLSERRVRTITQANTGAAGGWHRCIETALQENIDAVWLMDDDGYPDKNALENLVNAFKPGYSCLSSIVVKEDSPNFFVFPFPILNRSQMPVLFKLPRKVKRVEVLNLLSFDGTYPFAHLFNGTLVLTEAIRKIGNVNRDFFIYGEEVDYFFRLRKAGEVRSVISAIHFHPDVSLREFSIVKVYYYIKNSLILNKLYRDNYYVHHLLSICAIFWRISRANGYRFLLSLILGRYRSVCFAAISRGLMGKIGKDDNDEV